MTWIFAVLNYNGHLFADSRLTWVAAFIENAVCAVMPTLPLTFPAMWLLLNLWGVAKLETLLSIPRPFQEKSSPSEFHADLDNSPVVDWANLVLPWRTKVGNWINLIQGDASVLGRSSNVVQILGTMTALCCVDKKGILSWPNPTAEKVFFLRDPKDKQSAHSSSTSFESQQNEQRPQKEKSVAEVLDLTHDQHSPFKLEFDCQEWRDHLDSLKPLGKGYFLVSFPHNKNSGKLMVAVIFYCSNGLNKEFDMICLQVGADFTDRTPRKEQYI